MKKLGFFKKFGCVLFAAALLSGCAAENAPEPDSSAPSSSAPETSLKPSAEPVSDGAWSYRAPYTTGNTSGNINNYGLAAADEEWVYFSALCSVGIYRMHPDGSGLTMIATDEYAQGLTLSDGWLYFTDTFSYYRIRPDGSERETLFDEEQCYFSSVKDEQVTFTNGVELLRTDLDGGDVTLIAGEVTEKDETSYFYLNQLGDYLYFTNGNESEAGYLYRYQLEWPQMELVVKERIGFYCLTEEGLFYSAQKGLYRSDPDGGNPKRISEAKCGFFNVADGWIYYTDTEENADVWRMKTDGTQATRLTTDPAWYLNVAGGWVFYYHDSEDAFYRMRTDGSERTKVE